MFVYNETGKKVIGVITFPEPNGKTIAETLEPGKTYKALVSTRVLVKDSVPGARMGFIWEDGSISNWPLTEARIQFLGKTVWVTITEEVRECQFKGGKVTWHHRYPKEITLAE